MENRIFTIPAENIENLKLKIEKLNKKAVKLGCSPIESGKSLDK